TSLGAMLSALGTEKIGELLNRSAQELDPAQRGQLVGSLLNGLSTAGIDVPSLLGQLGINPALADNPEQASPAEIAALAAHTHQNHPGIFRWAMTFYEEHPVLAKTLAALAVAALAKHVYDGKQQ